MIKKLSLFGVLVAVLAVVFFGNMAKDEAATPLPNLEEEVVRTRSAPEEGALVEKIDKPVSVVKRAEQWPGFTYLQKNKQGYPEYRHKKSGIVFVALPGGQFPMGSPQNETGRLRDETLHKVSLSPFLIAKYEVTQAQWKKVMGKNPAHFRGNEHPVENISWTETQKFLKACGLMLPTEAQWEYACRAGWPGMFSPPPSISRAGWYDFNSDITGKGPTTHPVGKKQPNRFGIYDMHGNVSERCRDVYDKNFYSKPAASVKDPVNLDGRTLPDARYVIRGGRCATNMLNCRAAHRDNLWFPENDQDRTDANWFTGFRPVYR